jgi:hypothetical protein
MPQLPFDLATVDVRYVGTLALIAFIAAIVGNAVALGNRLVGSILTAVFFAVFYVAWAYWLAGFLGLPVVHGAATPT